MKKIAKFQLKLELIFLDPRIAVAEFWHFCKLWIVDCGPGIFEFCAHRDCKEMSCLYIMQQTKDSDRNGLHLLGEILLSVTFCTSTFFQIFVRPSEPCLGLYRIFSTFVKGFKLASPWRGRQGDPVGIGTFWDRAWNLKLSAPTLVPYGSPRCSAVVFPQ